MAGRKLLGKRKHGLELRAARLPVGLSYARCELDVDSETVGAKQTQKGGHRGYFPPGLVGGERGVRGRGLLGRASERKSRAKSRLAQKLRGGPGSNVHAEMVSYWIPSGNSCGWEFPARLPRRPIRAFL